MSKARWPDTLYPPDPAQIQVWINSFWTELAQLADLLPRQQYLLSSEQLHKLRLLVLQMMLALNGIQRPLTQDLNTYLSANQRKALEKTLLLPSVEQHAQADAWIGQAVSLVVIYRWYAPQLVSKYGLIYPLDGESQTQKLLLESLTSWPQIITTE